MIRLKFLICKIHSKMMLCLKAKRFSTCTLKAPLTRITKVTLAQITFKDSTLEILGTGSISLRNVLLICLIPNKTKDP